VSMRVGGGRDLGVQSDMERTNTVGTRIPVSGDDLSNTPL